MSFRTVGTSFRTVGMESMASIGCKECVVDCSTSPFRKDIACWISGIFNLDSVGQLSAIIPVSIGCRLSIGSALIAVNYSSVYLAYSSLLERKFGLRS